MPTAEPRGLRQAAIDWLQLRSDGGIEPLTREDILDFQFAGESVRLQAPMQGIWKPRGYAAALSFRTAYTKPGEPPPYEDKTGDDGLFRYKWRGTNPNHPENVGLREAMNLRLPLIWFLGVAMDPARYQVIAPVFIVLRSQNNSNSPSLLPKIPLRHLNWKGQCTKKLLVVTSSAWQRCACTNQRLGRWFFLHMRTVAPFAISGIPACSTRRTLCQTETNEESRQ